MHNFQEVNHLKCPRCKEEKPLNSFGLCVNCFTGFDDSQLIEFRKQTIRIIELDKLAINETEIHHKLRHKFKFNIFRRKK